MIRMQRENPVHRAGKDRVHMIGFRRHGETHMQEIRRIIQIIARIDERLANRIFIGHRGNRRHLGDQADRCHLALVFVVDIGAVVIECRHRAHDTNHGRHRMRIAAEATEKIVHLFVDHRVIGHE